MLKLLNQGERQQLLDIYRNEFGADLPDERQAKILAAEDGGELKAFVTSEILIRVGMVWVKPELRETPESAQMLRDMFRYLASNIPAGSSVIVIASDEKFGGLCKKSGMREIEGKIFRIDF